MAVDAPSGSRAADAAGSTGAFGDHAIYDLRIASTEDSLPLDASTSADTLCPSSIGPTADLAP